jgi:hypothetical protein
MSRVPWPDWRSKGKFITCTAIPAEDGTARRHLHQSWWCSCDEKGMGYTIIQLLIFSECRTPYIAPVLASSREGVKPMLLTV